LKILDQIVATNLEEGVSGLNLYRKRWGIECLFADAKTRGLNIRTLISPTPTSSPPCSSLSLTP